MQTINKFITIVSAVVFLTACDHSNTPSKQITPSDQAKENRIDSSGGHPNAGIYYCPMDPEIQSDKPGICPKCKMDLEIKHPKDSGETE